MDRNALVTGCKAEAGPVAQALERAGFLVELADSTGDLEVLASGLSPGSLACYIQLPFEMKAAGQGPLERAAQFLAVEVVARYEAAALALPLLKPDACVILIEGDSPPPGTPDQPTARADLLRGLSRALVGAFPAGELKSVIVGSDHVPEELAHMALQRGEDRQWLHSQVRSIPAGLSYSDWRNEIIGLS